jgi:hypothetical protein
MLGKQFAHSQCEIEFKPPADGHYYEQPHHLSYCHQGFIKKIEACNETNKRKNGQRKKSKINKTQSSPKKMDSKKERKK